MGGGILYKLSKNEERAVLAVIILLLAIIAVYKIIVFKSGSVHVVNKEETQEKQENWVEKSENNEKIFVYITGEVNKPGLYTMKNGDRIGDVINMACGFTKDADYASVNLAEKLKDEQYISVAKIITDNPDTGSPTAVRSSVVGGKININIATAKELDDFLPGIGETYANNIIDYRNKHGRFKSVDELTRVDSIGSGKRFQKIKDMVTVN